MAALLADAPLSIFDHLRELKRRVVYSCLAALICSIIAYGAYDPIIALLADPFSHVLGDDKPVLYVTSLFEGFLTRMKFAFIGGIVFSTPVHVYHLIRFIFPALKIKERRIVVACLIASMFLTIFSLLLCYFLLIPISMKFLITQEFIPNHVGIMLHFNQNIFYVFNFLLYAMLAFQFPIVLELMLYFNVVSRKTLLSSSRLIIVGIFLISAIVTPPDWISQLGVAVPMVALFYLTILIAKIFRFGESNPCSD